jgi:hypothetical protein
MILKTSILCYGIFKYIAYKNKSLNDFVKINLDIINNKSIVTKMENDVNVKKKISFACLIITPQSETETLIQDLNTINENLGLTQEIKHTNNIIYWKKLAPISINNLAFIPLSFYYSENISISNEALSYEVDLSKTKFDAGIYSVRFFVFSKEHPHRSTHRLISLDV